MPRRELLTDHQRAALSEPATDERTMVRFYTLTAEDRELLDRRLVEIVDDDPPGRGSAS